MKTDIKQLLKKHFGYDQFRLNQKEIIESVLNKKDTIALMPTGGGKSLCFQLPGLCIRRHLIGYFSPYFTNEVIVVDGLMKNGISAAYLNSAHDNEQKQMSSKPYQQGI